MESITEEIETLQAVFEDEIQICTEQNTNSFIISYSKPILNDFLISVQFTVNLENNNNFEICVTNQQNFVKKIPMNILSKIETNLKSIYKEQIDSMPIFQCISYCNDEMVEDDTLDLIESLKNIKSLATTDYCKLNNSSNDFMQYMLEFEQKEFEQNSKLFENEEKINYSKKKKKMKKLKQIKKKTRFNDFNSYWNDMQEHTKYMNNKANKIAKQNKLNQKKQQKKTDKKNEEQLRIKEVERKLKAMQNRADSFYISERVSKILNNNHALLAHFPTVDVVRSWLQYKYSGTEFSIRCILNENVLKRFLCGNGGLQHLKVVFHGTNSANDDSISDHGLVVGGTRGVRVVNGTAYGRGVYCSPNINLAGCYNRGSMYVCVVRERKVRQSGDVFVVPDDHDILPLYLASFSSGIFGSVVSGNGYASPSTVLPQIRGGGIMVFENNFNGNERKKRKRKKRF